MLFLSLLKISYLRSYKTHISISFKRIKYTFGIKLNCSSVIKILGECRNKLLNKNKLSLSFSTPQLSFFIYKLPTTIQSYLNDLHTECLLRILVASSYATSTEALIDAFPLPVACASYPGL